MTTIEVFRHDERMDCVEHERANVDRAYDTPLSTAGVAHAFAVAKNTTADLVVSSPLLRCVQTAIPWSKGRPLILDARLMEVYHPKLVGPLHEFKFRTNDELPPAFYIRTVHGFPKEERRGINGDADFRFRAAIQEYAENAHRSGMKHVQIFTHGDAIGSFAQMLGKEAYSTEFGCSITAIYNGSWEYVGSNDVGIF
jgi:broad specificity phosphatase PhoE